MMPVLELRAEWVVRPGDRVITARVEGERARRAKAAAYHRQFLNDPLMRERATLPRVIAQNPQGGSGRALSGDKARPSQHTQGT